MGYKKLTNNDWDMWLSKNNSQFKRVGNYEGANKGIIHYCTKCENESKPSPSNIKKGQKCIKCHLGTHKKLLENTPKNITLLSEYETARTFIKCKCDECDYRWEALPVQIRNIKGCPRCNNYAKFTHSEYVEILKQQRPEYEVMEKYINTDTKILHRHIKCGNEWMVEPKKIKEGNSCPLCSVSGFKTNKKATLYYLSINNGEAYKIGITNLSVKDRFNFNDLSKITVVKTWGYEDGEECYIKEQKILKDFKYAKWKGDALLTNGNSELFDRDILCLDSAS